MASLFHQIIKFYVSDTGFPQTRPPPSDTRLRCDGYQYLTGHRVFCDLGNAIPDGFRVDEDGNVWSSAGWAGAEEDGVQVFAPNGDKIGAIHTPEGISNVCFGGANRNRLFMTGLSRFTACTPKLRAWRTPESFVQIVLQTSKALLVRL